MDDPQKTPDKPRTASVLRADKQRQKIEEAVLARGRQLDELESRLAGEIKALSAEVQQATPAVEVLSPPPEGLATIREELKQLQGTFADSQQGLLRQQQELASQI